MAHGSFIPAAVSRQMRSREKPLWIGKPIPLKFAIKEGWATFVFGLPWTAAAVYWVFAAMGSGNMIFALIGVPLVAIGLYFLTTPLQEYKRARRTIYIVSNQRLIILNGLWRPTVESFAPSKIGSLEIDAAQDGSGSIIFHERREWRKNGGWFFSKIGFKAIPRVREAEDQILKLKGQGRREKSPKASAQEPSPGPVEYYRGYEIERIGDNCCVGNDTFADSASAKAHIDANWARSGQ